MRDGDMNVGLDIGSSSGPTSRASHAPANTAPATVVVEVG